MFNNKTYRIDDVDFRLNPTSILERTNGETMTYLEYYQKVFKPKNWLFYHKLKRVLGKLFLNNFFKKD